MNMARALHLAALPIAGSSADSIDIAEDRGRFERLLSELAVPQPPGAGVTTLEDAVTTAKAIGYPVLVRPSYVLGGRAMEVVQDANELVRFFQAALAEKTGAVLDRQVPRGTRGRGRRRLRRRGGADPRHHGAHRARRRALGRLDGRVPAAEPHGRAARGDRRLHDAHGARPQRARPDERAVRDLAEGRPRPRRPGRLRDRGQPALVTHRAVHLEGHGRADGADRGQRDARPARCASRATPRGCGPTATSSP